MLACILSDSLHFRSVTTTEADRSAASHLATISGIAVVCVCVCVRVRACVFVCVSVSLSLCLFVSAWLPVCRPACLAACLSLCCASHSVSVCLCLTDVRH